MDFDKARINDQELTYQIGALTVTWAHLEFTIDVMIWFIHKTMDGEKHEPEIPLALKRKIAYLKDTFKRWPITDSEREAYDTFLEDLRQESNARHDIIHGFPIHHPSDEGEAKLVRLIFRKTHWDQKPITITPASVAAAAGRARALADKIQKWTLTMADFREAYLKQQTPPAEPSA